MPRVEEAHKTKYPALIAENNQAQTLFEDSIRVAATLVDSIFDTRARSRTSINEPDYGELEERLAKNMRRLMTAFPAARDQETSAQVWFNDVYNEVGMRGLAPNILSNPEYRDLECSGIIFDFARVINTKLIDKGYTIRI